MIQYVIKRDGRKEPFNTDKINDWARWGEKTVHPKDFSWSGIVMRVVGSMPEEVTAQELQDALIRECLNQDTWEGSRMAGRLYASSLPKVLYEGRKHPHIKDLHAKLIDAGIVVKPNYTDEEYDLINKMLVHRRDYTYPHYAVNQLVKKYALQDRINRRAYETPQFIYMRVAMQTFNHYEKPDRMEKLKGLYEELSHQRINVPTPYFANSLTSNTNTCSCFPAGTLVDTEDRRVPIERVPVGSKVLTHTGEYQTVTDRFSRKFSGKMVTLNTVAGYNSEFECTYNHQIFAIKKTSTQAVKNSETAIPEWIEADHLRVGDYIKLGVDVSDLGFNYSVWDIVRNHELMADYDLVDGLIVRTRGVIRHKHPEVPNIMLNSEDFFRLLGYYLAEGCITHRKNGAKHFDLTFGTKDQDFIQDAIKICKDLFNLDLSIYPRDDNSTKLVTFSKVLVALMLELCGTGYAVKHLVPKIMTAPRNLQKHLLVGLIRGDGCSIISGFRVSMANKELIYQVKNICLRLGFHISLQEGKRPERYFNRPRFGTLRINVAGTSDFALLVNKDLYKIRQVKSVDGLHILVREDGVFARVRLLSSRMVEDLDVWDLTVDGDHSFVVNSLCVHNCSVITCQDEWQSIGVLNTLAYSLTTIGAGVGAHMKTRSINDPVRGGLVKHAGKVPYYRAFANVMKSSTQGCYDPETKVLTANGWIPFESVTKDTQIVQVAEDMSLSTSTPTDIIAYKHKGVMYHFTSDDVDVLVTPDHRMIYTRDGKLQEEIAETVEFKEGDILHLDVDITVDATTVRKDKVEDYDAMVYCVTVPTNIILVMRNHKTLVCGNSRSGASTMHFPVFDPEIEVLIGLKNPLSTLANRVRESDYAVSINKPFLKRAFTRKPFWLFSYKDNPELYEMFYHADSEAFDRELEAYAMANPEKVTEIDANHLLSEIMRHRVETGRLYIHFADISNHQTPYFDSIYSSNLCVAGDQLIPSNKGLLTADELYMLEGDGLELIGSQDVVKSTPMKLRGVDQDIFKITLSNGMTHKVTADHEVITTRGKVKCKDLVPGQDSLSFNVTEGIFGDKDMVDEAWLLGLYQGDGTQTKDDVHICVWDNKTAVLKDEILATYKRVREKHVGTVYYWPGGEKPYSEPKFSKNTKVGRNDKWTLTSRCLKKTLKFEKGVIPRWIREGTRETQLAYVKGLFQTDGTYNYNTKAGTHYLSITSIERKFLEDLQILLNNLGFVFSLCISSPAAKKLLPDQKGGKKLYDCKESYRLVSGNAYTCLRFEEATGFMTFRGKTIPAPKVSVKLPRNFAKVVSVEHAGKGNVYCPTVDSDDHVFVANGLYTLNCKEISLPTKPFSSHQDLYSEDPEGLVAFCNLAGLNIPHIKNDEEYERAAYYALTMIEHGIENSTPPFPALNANLKDWRSAGVGIVGLAYLMAKKGMSYTTQEGREFIHEQAERYGYFVTKAAIQLTKEYGTCKKASETKYATGWLPMDDASPAAKALVNRELAYDWDALREEMKALGGLRFSTLMAIAPSESSSISCSLTNSIYPARSLSLTKTSGDTSNKWVAPEATRLAKKYELAFDIDNEHHINNYALWQIFIDQGISADFFLDRSKVVDVSMAKLFKEIAQCAKLGVKTNYYYNTKTDKQDAVDFVNATQASVEDDGVDDSEGGCGSGGCTL